MRCVAQRRFLGLVSAVLLIGTADCGPAVEAGTPPACPQTVQAPTAAPATFAGKRPKLVVVIVLDQFRADYLARFEPHFGETGFKRLLREGASLTGHYGHYATYTGPGHALLLSGSYPYVNGISTNKFYNPATGRSEAMVFDAQSLRSGGLRVEHHLRRPVAGL